MDIFNNAPLTYDELIKMNVQPSMQDNLFKNSKSIMNTPQTSPSFDIFAPKESSSKGALKGAWYDFFGNTPASSLQAAGSMIGGIGAVYDAYNRNKYMKKAYKLEQEAIDRRLDRQREMAKTLHSVWGE